MKHTKYVDVITFRGYKMKPLYWFINGNWIMQNTNPSQFNYKYNGWNKTIVWANKTTSEYMQTFWWDWLAQIIAVSDMYQSFIYTETDYTQIIPDILIDVFRDMIVEDFHNVSVFKEIPAKDINTFIKVAILYYSRSYIGSVVPIISALQNNAKSIIELGDKFKNEVLAAKNKVDNTWGWHVDSYDPYREHMVRKYKSATVSGQASYNPNVHMINSNTTTIRGGRTYNVNALSPNIMNSKDELFSGIADIKINETKYEKNPEWDHD